MKMCCALAIEAVALNDIEHFWYAKMQLMWRPRITLSETIPFPLQMYSTDSACQLGPKTCQNIGGVNCKMVQCKGPKKNPQMLFRNRILHMKSNGILGFQNYVIH